MANTVVQDLIASLLKQLNRWHPLVLVQLCLSDTDCKKARTIAEQIRTVIEKKTYAYNSHPIHITCSLGVYTVDHPDSHTSYDSILQEVDNHLYQAKKAGRNQVSVR